MGDFFSKLKTPKTLIVLASIGAIVVFWVIVVAFLNGGEDAADQGIQSVVIAPQADSGESNEAATGTTQAQETSEANASELYKTYLSDSGFSNGFDWSHLETLDLNGDGVDEGVAVRGNNVMQTLTDENGIPKKSGDLMVLTLNDQSVTLCAENPNFEGLGGMQAFPMLYNGYSTGTTAFYQRTLSFGTVDGNSYLFVETDYESELSTQQRVEGYRLSPQGNLTAELVLLSTAMTGMDAGDFKINGNTVSEADYQSAMNQLATSDSGLTLIESLEPDDATGGIYASIAYGGNLSASDPALVRGMALESGEEATAKASDEAVDSTDIVAEEGEDVSQGADTASEAVQDFLDTGIVNGVTLGTFTVPEMVEKYGSYLSSYKDTESNYEESQPIPYFDYPDITFQTSFEDPEGTIYTAVVKNFAGISTDGSSTRADVKAALGEAFNETKRSAYEAYLPPSYTSVTGSVATLMIGYDANGTVMDIILTTP